MDINNINMNWGFTWRQIFGYSFSAAFGWTLGCKVVEAIACLLREIALYYG